MGVLLGVRYKIYFFYLSAIVACVSFSACSLKQKADSKGGGSKVSMVLPGSHSSSNNSLNQSGKSYGAPNAPESLDEFDCFAVNVKGPGIVSTSLNFVGETCGPLGVTSHFVPRAPYDQTIDLNDVPKGSDRVFQIVGFKLQPNKVCPQVFPQFLGDEEFQNTFSSAHLVGLAPAQTIDQDEMAVTVHANPPGDYPSCNDLGPTPLTFLDGTMVSTLSLDSSAGSSGAVTFNKPGSVLSILDDGGCSPSDFTWSLSGSDPGEFLISSVYGKTAACTFTISDLDGFTVDIYVDEYDGSGGGGGSTPLLTYDNLNTALIELESSGATDTKSVIFNKPAIDIASIDHSSCDTFVDVTVGTDIGTGNYEVIISSIAGQSVNCTIYVSDNDNNLFDIVVEEINSGGGGGPTLTTIDGETSASVVVNSFYSETKIIYFNKPTTGLISSPSIDCDGNVNASLMNYQNNVGGLLISSVFGQTTSGCIIDIFDPYDSSIFSVSVEEIYYNFVPYPDSGNDVYFDYGGFFPTNTISFWGVDNDFDFHVSAQLKAKSANTVTFSNAHGVSVQLKDNVNQTVFTGNDGRFKNAGAGTFTLTDSSFEFFDVPISVSSTYLPVAQGEYATYSLSVSNGLGAYLDLPVRLRRLGRSPVTVSIEPISGENSLKKVIVSKSISDLGSVSVSPIGPQTLEVLSGGVSLYLMPDTNPDTGAQQIACDFEAVTILYDGKSCTFILGNSDVSVGATADLLLNLVINAGVGSYIGIHQERLIGANSVQFNSDSTPQAIHYSAPENLYLDSTVSEEVVIPVLVENVSGSPKDGFDLMNQIILVTVETPSNARYFVRNTEYHVEGCSPVNLRSDSGFSLNCLGALHLPNFVRNYPTKITVLIKGVGTEVSKKLTIETEPSDDSVGMDWGSPLYVDSNHFALFMRNVAGAPIYPFALSGFGGLGGGFNHWFYIDSQVLTFQYAKDFSNYDQVQGSATLTRSMADGELKMAVFTKSTAGISTNQSVNFNIQYVFDPANPYSNGQTTQISFIVP